MKSSIAEESIESDRKWGVTLLHGKGVFITLALPARASVMGADLIDKSWVAILLEI